MIAVTVDVPHLPVVRQHHAVTAMTVMVMVMATFRFSQCPFGLDLVGQLTAVVVPDERVLARPERDPDPDERLGRPLPRVHELNRLEDSL